MHPHVVFVLTALTGPELTHDDFVHEKSPSKQLPDLASNTSGINVHTNKVPLIQ